MAEPVAAVAEAGLVEVGLGAVGTVVVGLAMVGRAASVVVGGAPAERTWAAAVAQLEGGG